MQGYEPTTLCELMTIIYLALYIFSILTLPLGLILLVLGFIILKFMKSKNKLVVIAGKIMLGLGGIITLVSVIFFAMEFLTSAGLLRCR